MNLLAPILQVCISLMVGTAGATAWWFIDQTRKIGHILVAGLLLTVMAYGALAGLSAIPAGATEVTIDFPPSGMVVEEPEVKVSGTVSPPDARVFVLVYPWDSNRWWVQAEPTLTESNSGSAWETTVVLGSNALGSEEGFEIVAVASRDPLLFDVLNERYYEPGQELDSLPPLSRSNSATVFRK